MRWKKMVRTRIIKEELYVLIWIPRTCGYDTMGGYTIPEKIFYDEPYTNEETADMLLALAKKEHKKHPHHAWASEPIREDYWRRISEEVEDYD
jgi:hypothetical protein